MSKPLRFGAIGIDHRHIYGMAGSMIKAGAEFIGWWTEGHPPPETGMIERFPDIPRVGTAAQLLEDDSIDLILLSGIPRDRADWAIAAMEAGKDVMTDKPGCISFEQLDALKACVARTGQIWSRKVRLARLCKHWVWGRTA